MTTFTFNKTNATKGTERLRSFLFDTFEQTNNKEESIKMNNNVFTKAIDSVKAGLGKVTSNEKVNNVVEATATYAGKAYRFAKTVVKKYWKNAVLGVAATVVAGTVTTGGAAAAFAGAGIYAGVKTLAYAIKHNKSMTLGDAATEMLYQYINGLAWSLATLLAVWYVIPYFLVDLAVLLNLGYAKLVEGWIYSFYFIFA